MYNNMFLFHHFVYLLIKLNKGDVYCQKKKSEDLILLFIY